MSLEESKPGAPAPGQMSQAELRQAAQAAVGNGAVPYGEGSIERIRDLLFGDDFRHIKQEIVALREAFSQRFDVLENDLKTEMAALDQRLTAEQETRTGSIEKLVRDVRELGRRFEKKTAQLAEQTAESGDELRELLLEQSKTLAKDIRNRYDDISALLDQQLEALRQVKTDRAALASLFGDMASRLNHELSVPESHEEEAQ